MRSRIGLVSVGTLGVLALVGGGLAFASAGAGATGHRAWGATPRVASSSVARTTEPKITTGETIALRDHFVEEADIDVGARGEGPGDYFEFRTNELNPSTGARVGEAHAQGTIHFTTIVYEATFVLFGRGKVIVEGASYGQRTFTLAITGGTGEFQNARGQAEISPGPGDDTKIVLRLIP